MSAARASFSLFAPRAANCERCGVTKISMGNDVITRSTARKRILDPLTGGIFASVQRDAADCADSADLCIRKRKKEAPTCFTLWSCLAWRLCTSKRARVSFALAQLNHEFARKSATDATCACRGRDGALFDNAGCRRQELPRCSKKVFDRFLYKSPPSSATLGSELMAIEEPRADRTSISSPSRLLEPSLTPFQVAGQRVGRATEVSLSCDCPCERKRW